MNQLQLAVETHDQLLRDLAEIYVLLGAVTQQDVVEHIRWLKIVSEEYGGAMQRLNGLYRLLEVDGYHAAALAIRDSRG